MHRGIKEETRRPRVEVTLRGLRFTDHPKNPAEVRGVVVAWERVACAGSPQTGQVSVLRVYREDGSEVRSGRIAAAFRFENHEGALARRAVRRRWRQILSRGETLVIERCDAGGSLAAFLMMVVLGAGLLGVTLVYMVAPVFQGFWLQTWSGRALTLVIVGAMLAYAATIGTLPAFLMWSRLRVKVRELAVTAGGFEATFPDGQRRWHSWEDLRRVRATLAGTYELVFSDGVRLFVPRGRTAPAFEQQRDRLEPGRKERERGSQRRVLIRCLVYCQIGGLGAAWLAMWIRGSGMTLGTGAPGPIGAYMAVAFGMPSLIAAQLAAPRAVAWLDKRASRRKRRRARSDAAGRVVG